ncbi:hypothetical protein BDF22DRAFT_734522 [Syncephalis plumigaleata]|nr:hypothetical protein BDF22DRAFT_734522 [Syncephalis plumigaleata]
MCSCPDSGRINLAYSTLIDYYVLHEIFDFDNTLFCSPLPNPRLWHRSLIGRLMSPEVGWFRDARTLSEPFVICRKSTTGGSPTCEWFSTHVLQRVRDVIDDTGTLTILLTGRSRSVYHARITELLLEHELQFDLLILREYHDTIATTMQFKKHVIHRLLNLFTHANELVMWEDRSNHAVQFKRFLDELQASERLATGNVVKVTPAISYMERQLEVQLQLWRVDFRSNVLQQRYGTAKMWWVWKVDLYPVEVDYGRNWISVVLMVEHPQLTIKYPLGRRTTLMKDRSRHDAMTRTVPWITLTGSLMMTCLPGLKK